MRIYLSYHKIIIENITYTFVSFSNIFHCLICKMQILAPSPSAKQLHPPPSSQSLPFIPPSSSISNQAPCTTTLSEEAPAPPPSSTKVKSDDSSKVFDQEQPSTSAAAASSNQATVAVSKPLRLTLRLCTAAASKLRRLALHNPRTLRKLGKWNFN